MILQKTKLYIVFWVDMLLIIELLSVCNQRNFTAQAANPFMIDVVLIA